jgi:PAS domain S-box-containing protein
VLDDRFGARSAPIQDTGVRRGQLEAFSEKVRDARSVIAERRPSADVPTVAETGPRSPSDARVLMEELNVAEEELHAQYDEILESRERLEQERIRYLELFELAPDAYLVTDVAGTIGEANVAAQRLLGLRPERRSRRTLVSLVVDPARRDFRQRLGELEVRCRRTTVNLALRTGGGRVVDVEATVAPIVRDDRCTGHRWLLRDVTAQRLIERENAQLRVRLEETVAERTAELEKALDSAREAFEVAARESARKSEFLAFLSHEVRTPMQAIVGYSDMFAMELHGPLTPAQREDLARMQRGQQHILQLLDQLLDYARIESGHVQLQPRPVALDQVCESALELVRPQALAASVTASCEGDRVIVRADAEKARQVLINLVSNAVKFGPRPGRVRIRTRRDDKFGVVTVEDDGAGIPRHIAEGIFEPFVHHGLTTPGVGLGLPISRRLARAMNGELRLDASAHCTRFELSLPLA